MTTTMWRSGRRLFSTAGVLMLLTSLAHTAGNVMSRPETPEEQRVFAEMRGYHVPMGLQMNPSVYDIYWTLALTMSITFAALGLINLLLAGSRDIPDWALRRVGWVNALWVGAFLVLAAVYRIPPPLISAVIIEVAVIGSVVSLRRA